MKREDDQELWDLLGKASAPELSPFFARNVLREVRQERQGSGWRAALLAWLRPGRLVPARAVALVLFVAALSWQQRSMQNDLGGDNPPDLLASIDPQDLDAVADLDDLLASEDDNLWSEPSSL